MGQAHFGKIDQIGYIVTDLDRGIRHWIDHMGVGPWTVFRDVVLAGTYRGQATSVTMHVGLAYQGDMQIELIEVANDSPSPYRDADGKLLVGPHHLAWVVDDLDAATAAAGKRGLTITFAAENPGMRVAYLESDEEPGVRYELLEAPYMRGMIDAGIAATRDWDGSDPVTLMTAAG